MFVLGDSKYYVPVVKDVIAGGEESILNVPHNIHNESAIISGVDYVFGDLFVELFDTGVIEGSVCYPTLMELSTK